MNQVFDADINKAADDLARLCEVKGVDLDSLSELVRISEKFLLDMTYNLGASRVRKFQ